MTTELSRCDDACIDRRYTKWAAEQKPPVSFSRQGRVLHVKKIKKTDPDVTPPHAGTPGFRCEEHVVDPVE